MFQRSLMLTLADAGKYARASPTREWTVEERREAFLEGQREDRQKAEAGRG